MENENLITKTVYNIIRSLVPGIWIDENLPKTEDEVREYKSLRIELTESSFPKTLSLKFEELPTVLKRLNKLGLIKFDGKIDSKIIKNLNSKVFERTQVLRIWFLKFADIDEMLKDKKEFKNNKNTIKKIDVIKMKDGKRLIAINDNYNEAKQIRNSEWWDIFVREIEERNMSNRTNVKTIPRDMVDYFNYNNGKCPIYMDGKYCLTNVFVGRDIDTIINPEIKTKVMTERQYLARKNRKK